MTRPLEPALGLPLFRRIALVAQPSDRDNNPNDGNSQQSDKFEEHEQIRRPSPDLCRNAVERPAIETKSFVSCVSI